MGSFTASGELVTTLDATGGIVHTSAGSLDKKGASYVPNFFK
jgi:hypothetical protein